MAEWLTSGDLIDGKDARRILHVLRRIIRDSDEASQAVDAFRDVVSRIDGDEVLQSCADWWSRVHTGADPATQFAYAPSELIDAEIREQMLTVITSRLPPPISESWRLRRSLEEQVQAVDEALSLENHGNIAIAQEHQIWRAFVERMRPHLDAARELRLIEDSYPTDSEFKQLLRENDVIRGSQVWNKLMRIRTDVVAKVDGLRRIVEVVAEWSDIGALPEPLVEWSGVFHEGERSFERACLSELVVADPDSVSGMSGDEALAQVSSWGDEAGGPALVRLALIIGTWPGRVAVRSPGLNQVSARIRDIAQRMNRLERAGSDVTEAREVLGVLFDLDAAIDLVDRLEIEREMGRQADELGRRLKVIRQAAQTAAPDGSLQSVLAEIERQLSNQEVLAAEKSIGEVEREVRNLLRTMLQSLLDESLDSVQTLRSPRLANGESIDEFTSALQAELGRLRAGDANDLNVLLGDIQKLKRGIDDLVRSSLGMLDDFVTSVTTMAFELGDPSEEMAQEFEDLSHLVADLRSDCDDLGDFAELGDVADVIRSAERCFDEVARIRLSLVGNRFGEDDSETDLLDRIIAYCTQEYAYHPRDVRRLYISVKSKPFVILTGLAGSGKSTIARLFANAIGATTKNRTFERVAVRPDWIDQSEVLGYLNPVNNTFQPGWLAVTVRECLQRPNEIFVVLLDEMNLAPIEQYFAEYLSAAEEHRSGSDEVYMSLYREGSRVANDDDWPPSLRFPDNLIVIGTANIDETTRVLSDRVLDRANVIQLSTEVGYEHHSARAPGSVQPWTVAFDRWRRIRSRTVPTDEFHDELVSIGTIMRDHMRIGLGVRSHLEIERYLAAASQLAQAVDAFDDQMLQRVLPKIRGYRYDLEDGLQALRQVWLALGLTRSVAVLDDWLADDRTPETLLDGLSASVGLASSTD